jgi:CRISPR-associated protein Cmr4
MFKQIKLLFLYTETPLHVGSGSSLGTVDLPIQRERHTNLPMVQASGIKGKLRSAFSQNFNNANADESAKHKRNELVKVIFGPEGNGSSEHAGALSPGDGRILLFPVRSLAGVFAWITCPLVINRLIRDLNLANHSHNWNIEPSDGEALVPSGSKLVVSDAVVLEEFSFTAIKNHQQVQNLANWLADNALPAGDEYKFWRDKLKQDLVVISNEAFTDFCKFSTDVVSRTKLNAEKKTVEDGALWTEENLPADSLLYTPLFASDPRIANKENILTEVENAAAILNTVQTYLTSNHSRLQLGGNETVGRGIVATRVL